MEKEREKRHTKKGRKAKGIKADEDRKNTKNNGKTESKKDREKKRNKKEKK